jgi:hypothetical protein
MLYQVKLKFTESLLGTAPADPEVYKKFILEKAPVVEAEEVETLPVEDGGAITVFHRFNDQPALYDYHIRGFFKDACSSLRRIKESLSSNLTAYKKHIDGLVFVAPRLIPIQYEGEIETLERPLRAQTAKGERIALTKSEMLPAGSIIEFNLNSLGDVVKEELLREWFEYGSLKGLGQWRNGGYGTFLYEMNAISNG